MKKKTTQRSARRAAGSNAAERAAVIVVKLKRKLRAQEYQLAKVEAELEAFKLALDKATEVRAPIVERLDNIAKRLLEQDTPVRAHGDALGEVAVFLEPVDDATPVLLKTSGGMLTGAILANASLTIRTHAEALVQRGKVLNELGNALGEVCNDVRAGRATL